MEELRPIDCWDCKYLGPCLVYGQKCEGFKKFNYGKTTWTIKKISREMNISTSTFNLWLKNYGEEFIVERIRTETGMLFTYVKVKKKKYRKLMLLKVGEIEV